MGADALAASFNDYQVYQCQLGLSSRFNTCILDSCFKQAYHFEDFFNTLQDLNNCTSQGAQKSALIRR